LFLAVLTRHPAQNGQKSSSGRQAEPRLAQGQGKIHAAGTADLRITVDLTTED
jgi:hypothetical protein